MACIRAMQEQLPRSKNLPCRRRLSVEQPHPLRNRYFLCRASYIEKLDNESKSTNFHSNVHEGLAIAPANESQRYLVVRSFPSSAWEGSSGSSASRDCKRSLQSCFPSRAWETAMNTKLRTFTVTFMKARQSPRQMKVFYVGRARSLARQDAVNTSV